MTQGKIVAYLIYHILSLLFMVVLAVSCADVSLFIPIGAVIKISMDISYFIKYLEMFYDV